MKPGQGRGRSPARLGWFWGNISDPCPTRSCPSARPPKAGARRALDGVSLDVRKGEMIALIGPSGSGKTTLLRSISGLQTIDPGEGVIEAFGDPVQEHGKISSGVRKRPAPASASSPSSSTWSAASTSSATWPWARSGRIETWRGLTGQWPQGDRRPPPWRLLARVGVADYAAQRANTLSGGQQQRGAIARALVQKAKIILADEPVASLDPVAARKVMENCAT